jgi:hypothetical protein
MYENISIERLEQIQRDRESTYIDRAFQQWAKAFNVSASVTDRTGIIRARDLMREWDGSRLRIKP